MSDLNKTLEEMKGLIEGQLKETRDEMQEVKKGSARFDELSEKHDRVLSDFDKLQAKLEGIELALARPAASEEKEEAVDSEYKSAFEHYLRTADARKLEDAAREIKTLATYNDPDGGYVVPTEMSSRIITNIYETSPVRQLAGVSTTANKDREYLVDIDEAGAGWVGEGGTISDTDTPQFNRLKVETHKMYAQPLMTTEMIQDSELDIEAWLSGKVADKMVRTENTAFVSGDGVGKPRGFLTYTAGTAYGQVQQVETAASNVVDEIDLIEVMGALKDGYRIGAQWAMSRQTNTVIRKLQDSNGAFLFSGQDLMDNTLFGFQIVRLEDMVGPTSGTTFADNALAIGFGNFKEGYAILDRQGISMLRDPFTSKGYVKYFTTRRVGGGVVNFEAIKLLKVKAA